MPESSFYKAPATLSASDLSPSQALDSGGSPQSPASPTGVPVLPPAVVPWLTGIVGLAVLGAQVLPPYTIAAHVCAGIASLAALLGLASPGLRRQPPAP